ncbi:leucine-rich repeat domain-containing protein [Carboxylicivirga marina]|uniref:leucine-rich repeat domain-containing protein n=1 Tax=Carboxylicivirga marina TaxID=2800988 RepID=UPI002593728A|nr:leucine-rich repeat domain-containing protein [uncultured Carboxylicivirga sp.]
MSDIELIKELNKHLTRPLKQLKKISWITKGYVLNDNSEVTHLSIFKSRLKGHIPQELFELTKLKYIDIRDNEITKIPEDISRLKSLKYIDIRINKLSDLPQSISYLKDLERLYLGQNDYKSVPEIISELKALDLIDFSDNQINAGCDALLSAPKLKNIYLNNNQLTNFPFDKVKNNQLEELILLDNPLSDYHGMTRDKIGRLVL